MIVISRNARGSSYDRRRRREWLIRTYGRGPWVFCHCCGRRMYARKPGGLSNPQWQVDRWPIPGRAGGRYRRENIRIACRECNRKGCPHLNHANVKVMLG